MRVLTAFLIVLFLGACPNNNNTNNNGTRPTSGKMIIFDAGSSGTRVFIYDWNAQNGGVPKVNEVSIPAQDAAGNKLVNKVAPGVHNFAGVDQFTVSGAGQTLEQYFAPLITALKSQLDAATLASTPVYLMATGGVRTLMNGLDFTNTAQPTNTQINELFTRIASVFKNNGLNNVQKTQALHGDFEGLFAWLGVNAMSNALYNSAKYDAKTTQGILEMGGYSFQISFIPAQLPADKTLGPQDHYYSFQLGSNSFSMYTFSYDQLGLNFATNAANALSPEIVSANPDLANCFNLGDKQQSDVLRPFQNVTQNYLSYLPSGDPAKGGCRDFIVDNLLASPKGGFNQLSCFPFCGLKEVSQPSAQFSSFAGLSNFYNIAQSFNLGTVSSDQKTRTYTPQEALDAAIAVCPMSSQNILANYGTYITPAFQAAVSQQGCFQLSLLKLVLTGSATKAFPGLGIDLNADIASFANSPSWTYGAAIYEANTLANGQNATISTAYTVPAT